MPQCRQWRKLRKKEFRAKLQRQVCLGSSKLQILRPRIEEASPAARLTVFREHMSILGPCAPTSTRFFPFPWEHRVLELRGFDAIPCLYVRICAESQCVSPDIWLRRTVVVHDTSPIGNNIHTRFNKSYWHI